jgi:hypothetical protein
MELVSAVQLQLYCDAQQAMNGKRIRVPFSATIRLMLEPTDTKSGLANGQPVSRFTNQYAV